MKSPVDFLKALVKDIRVWVPVAKGLDRDIQTIENRVKHEGDSFLTITLPIIDEALLRGLENGRFICPSNFRRKGALPLFLRGLLMNVFDVNTGLLLEEPCIESIRCIRQFTRVFKKLSLKPSDQAKLELSAYKKYERIENEIRDSFDSRKLHLLSLVSHFLLYDLGSFDPLSITGKHGPGSVYEQMTPNDKWRYLMGCLFHADPLKGTIYPELFCLENLPLIEASSARSRVISVPKNSTSVRLITVEPFLRQFVQGGLNTYLRDFISRNRYLANCLDLRDQSANQKLALGSSLTRELSTIDLSSASDSISLSLCDEVFGRYENFYQVLMSSRSPESEFNGVKFTLRKYAGMGNATTFPIQSIIYAAILIAAYHDMSGIKPTVNSMSRASRLIRCFGDDLIVPSTMYEKATEWLTDFGFTVNLDKSFTNGYFRESCGVDAYKGVDITPIYVRHYPHTGAESVTIPALVASSNQLWLKGYNNAGNYLKDLVEETLGRRLPHVPFDSSSLGWHTRVNARTIERWNKHLHRFEYRGLVIRSKTRIDPLDGYAALLKYFHLGGTDSDGLLLTSPDHLKKSQVRYHGSISNQWCP